MILLDILGNILQSDLQIDQLENALKNAYTFMGGIIQLNVQYSLEFVVNYEVDVGFSTFRFVYIKDTDELNTFISSGHEDILSRINDRRRLYPEGCNWGSMGPNG
jgi:hypothetical protein